mgnify:FL=1|tara:strand:- start:468 stop:728 length:261 start_codon:yes stop_codon:yes gene_type:complete
MNEYVLYSVLGLGMVAGLYFLGRRMYRRHKIHKDYNRVITDEQRVIKNELEFLRKELIKTDIPERRNEYLNKIDLLIKSYKEDIKV